MIKLHFEKLSRYARSGEFVECSVPFAIGKLTDAAKVLISHGDRCFRPQTAVCARWEDGSIKWLHLSFLAELPANAAADYYLTTEDIPPNCQLPSIEADLASRTVDTGALHAVLAGKGSSCLFKELGCADFVFSGFELAGPFLVSGGNSYTVRLEEDWKLSGHGPFRVIAENQGRHYDEKGNSLFSFHVRLHFTAGHPWFQLEYRFIHKEEAAELPLEALFFLVREHDAGAKTALCISNYASDIVRGSGETEVYKLIDAEYLLYDANEQAPQTLYGTFLADWTNGEKGICATVYQAHQNFPKALRAGPFGLEVSLMPASHAPVHVLQGMSKTHSIFLHLHDPRVEFSELNIRSLQMQLPDRPVLEPAVYREAGVTEDIHMDALAPRVEAHLMSRADATGSAYGMLCWGDVPDLGYTRQGRGQGRLVWTNNEYDYPHACFLMYVRTGERRYLDMLAAAARHWMDVDICHYSADPLRQGAQIVHSANHVTERAVPSHEWVEGLLDYYHLTGEMRGLELALGIGENVLRLLETPMFQNKGEINARETGWALRSLTALYVETHDEKWLSKCEWIVGHFTEWREELGGWLAPYTDHTAIRVPFMISVAAGSLMRYYRVRPAGHIRGMILAAMDDLLENALLPSGLFYYKELPSLRRISLNPIVLEALAYAYELSGDARYVEAGIPLFEAILAKSDSSGGGKTIMEDALVCSGAGSKVFAQSHLPTAIFAKALEQSGKIDRIR
jgi:hypothetical protein